jgi:hypothetical protein
MPIRYTIHADLGLVVTRFTGQVSDEEFVDTYRRIMADSAYVPGTNELADLRQVELLDLTARGLRQVEELTGERYAGTGAAFRTAILAPADSSYGMARMYEVFAEDGPEHVRVCREMADALKWLDLETDDVNL